MERPAHAFRRRAFARKNRSFDQGACECADSGRRGKDGLDHAGASELRRISIRVGTAAGIGVGYEGRAYAGVCPDGLPDVGGAWCPGRPPADRLVVCCPRVDRGRADAGGRVQRSRGPARQYGVPVRLHRPVSRPGSPLAPLQRSGSHRARCAFERLRKAGARQQRRDQALLRLNIRRHLSCGRQADRLRPRGAPALPLGCRPDGDARHAELELPQDPHRTRRSCDRLVQCRKRHRREARPCRRGGARRGPIEASTIGRSRLEKPL